MDVFYHLSKSFDDLTERLTFTIVPNNGTIKLIKRTKG
jgi:hypothetical protein